MNKDEARAPPTSGSPFHQRAEAGYRHSPDHEVATGTSTTGSNEAAMLGGMALKWQWPEQDAG